MNYILGISGYYHDSAAALIKDGVVIAAAQEERFTRKKNDLSFPENAVLYCLSEASIKMSDVDTVVFYDKPFLKFERILQTFYEHAPFGFPSFLKGIAIWIKEKIFFKKMLRSELSKFDGYDKKRIKLLFTEHHLSHAASAFFTSPYDKAAILTIDGVGEWATLAISLGENNSIKVIKEMHFPDSVGLLYSAFTYYLGFRVNSGEYKLMGLAPYGERSSEVTIRFVELIKSNLVTIHSDGSITLNQKFFNYESGLTMTKNKEWEVLFGFPRREPESSLLSHHTCLAAAAQIVTEDILLKLVAEAKAVTGVSSLCLAGGVALNCVANAEIVKSNCFENVFIQPAAGDAGGALGAALAAYYIYFDNERQVQLGDGMNGAFLGPGFTNEEIKDYADKNDLTYQFFESQDDLCDYVAELLSLQNCIGWFQGRMEFGPRALGNRSILADPRSVDMQERLNLKIKFRESFRPFAPAILKEDTVTYFDLSIDSDYMLLTTEIKDSFKKPLPKNYLEMPIMDKLKIPKSFFPSITHVDYSSRVQTVDSIKNPLFWSLLKAFKTKTSCPMLINTSFNVRGEPIVCTPEDAFNCFINTEMDYLVMGNLVFKKL